MQKLKNSLKHEDAKCVGIMPVFSFVPSVSIIHAEAIVTSFLYLVSYRVHSEAIVAVSVCRSKHGTRQ